MAVRMNFRYGSETT